MTVWLLAFWLPVLLATLLTWPPTLLWGSKDGGPESRVRMWGFEQKALCSVLLLRFEEGTREAFHTHAFNAWSWVLAGNLIEQTLPGKPENPPASPEQQKWMPQDITWAGFGPPWSTGIWAPIYTDRRRFHKVAGGSRGAWAITFRGPWWTGWREYDPTTHQQTKLANGRRTRE